MQNTCQQKSDEKIEFLTISTVCESFRPKINFLGEIFAIFSRDLKSAKMSFSFAKTRLLICKIFPETLFRKLVPAFLKKLEGDQISVLSDKEVSVYNKHRIGSYLSSYLSDLNSIFYVPSGTDLYVDCSSRHPEELCPDRSRILVSEC